MGGDDDAFVAWDAAQTLLARAIECATPDSTSGTSAGLNKACEQVVTGAMDPAMKALTLTLPSEEYLADRAAQQDWSTWRLCTRNVSRWYPWERA